MVTRARAHTHTHTHTRTHARTHADSNGTLIVAHAEQFWHIVQNFNFHRVTLAYGLPNHAGPPVRSAGELVYTGTGVSVAMMLSAMPGDLPSMQGAGCEERSRRVGSRSCFYLRFMRLTLRSYCSVTMLLLATPADFPSMPIQPQEGSMVCVGDCVTL